MNSHVVNYLSCCLLGCMLFLPGTESAAWIDTGLPEHTKDGDSASFTLAIAAYPGAEVTFQDSTWGPPSCDIAYPDQLIDMTRTTSSGKLALRNVSPIQFYLISFNKRAFNWSLENPMELHDAADNLIWSGFPEEVHMNFGHDSTEGRNVGRWINAGWIKTPTDMNSIALKTLGQEYLTSTISWKITDLTFVMPPDFPDKDAYKVSVALDFTCYDTP